MRCHSIKFFILIYLFIINSCFAEDLMSVYQQALISDPTFQAARTTYLSETQEYPIARSVLLPNIQFSGENSFNRTSTSSEFVTEHRSLGLNFNATQSIIDFGKWVNLHIASAHIKAAAANFAAAEQDLMLRTGQAYFNVLEAEDNLRFTQAEKRATAKQLDQAQQRFNVGLDAITSVYDARAEYDANVAQEIAAQNAVVNSREELREITGKYYQNLVPLQGKLPLSTPQPANVESWVNVVDLQNLDIIAAKFHTLAARENIKLKFAGHLPIVNAVGGYDHGDQNGEDPEFSGEDSIRAGIEFNLPIYQGGLVLAETRQARYDYETAVAELERSHRTATVTTRETYNDVVSGISKINADKQAIISRQSSVDSQEAAMQVGTRTIVDVLQAQRDLFETKKILSTDQYKYINDALKIKSLTGTLNIDDIQIVNTWLHKPNYKIINKDIPHKLIEGVHIPNYMISSKSTNHTQIINWHH